MQIIKKILRFVLPLLVLGVGIGVFRGLVATRPQAQRGAPPSAVTPVRVTRVQAGPHTVSVTGHGLVVPARELALQAELNARVVGRHADLVPGGVIARGQTLVRLDPRDFRTAIAQQTAQLETQRVQLQTEERRAAVAQREWELLASQSSALEASPEGRALALREPQMRSAQAGIAATDAQLAQARLTMSRTTLRAPFDALVREADVEVGQLVGPAARLATLVDLASFWVQVSLPLESIRPLLRVGPTGPSIDAAARVVHSAGGVVSTRDGRVVRLLGDLDPMGRMARVLVEVEDPLELQGPHGESPAPLFLGAYVEVSIEVGALEASFEIPRAALRDDDHVWLLEDGVLAIRPVVVAHRGTDSVIVTGGLSEGDALVTSPLAAPIAGMQLREAGVTPASPTVTAAAGGTTP